MPDSQKKIRQKQPKTLPSAKKRLGDQWCVAAEESSAPLISKITSSLLVPVTTML
jgi:hypothetical protein